MIHHKMVMRKARGRRYGVVSNGRKFHGQVKRKSRTWRKSWAKRIDREEHLRTRDQEWYFKKYIKPVLMLPPYGSKALAHEQPTRLLDTAQDKGLPSPKGEEVGITGCKI